MILALQVTQLLAPLHGVVGLTALETVLGFRGFLGAAGCSGGGNLCLFHGCGGQAFLCCGVLCLLGSPPLFLWGSGGIISVIITVL